MLLSPSMLKRALLDAQRGDGISPSTSQVLLDQGWAEWVDFEFGTPIDENSPRSLLRLTAAGAAQMASLEATSLDLPTNAQPLGKGAAATNFPGFQPQPAS